MNDIKTVVPNIYNYAISTSTDTPLVASGVDSLVQIISKAIKTTPGRDIFNPTYGMGIKELLPSSSARIEEQRAKSQVGKGLMKIEEEIKTNQESLSLTASQKLEKLELVDLIFDPQNSLWDVTIRVTSSTGTTIVVGLSV
jgi:phage baseplate assembly protein W